MNAAEVALVVGTRPEAIKLAPVARALLARGVAARLLLTGQHPGLEPGDYDFPRLCAVALGGAASHDPHADAAAVAQAVLPHLSGVRLVLVQGDTSSAFGAALAAASAGIALGHVEAGLRSHDVTRPWPEEEFRIAIDRLAALLFAPSALSAANLRRERVGGIIQVTGNTGVDAALAIAPRMRAVQEGGAQLLVTCHRRESWGEGLASIAAALHRLAASGSARIRFVLHPNPHVAQRMRELLAGSAAIELCPPCSHGQMLDEMRRATLVLTDSGGMQEEAPALGVPLLVLRERTERPEGIATGNIELVGVETGRIVAAVERLLSDPIRLAAMGRPALPYGDGRAAERIAATVCDFLQVPRRSRAA